MADMDSIASSVGYEERLEAFPCHFMWRLDDKCGRDFKTAMEYIDHHLAHNPDEMTVPAMAVKAYLYMSNLKDNNLKDPQAALEWIEDALERNESDLREDASHDGPIGYKVVLLADQAWVYFKLGEIEKAEPLIEELEAHPPLSKKAEAYLKAIKAFTFQWFSRSKFLEGIESYKEALIVFPSNVDWLFGYTRLLEKKKHNPTQGVGEVTKIEQNLRHILKVNPKHGLARAFLAKALAEKGSHLEAEYEANRALDIDGNNFVVVQRVGEAFLKLEKFDEALELFEEARDSEADSSFTLGLIGSVYTKKYYKQKPGKRSKANLEKALEYYQQAIEADNSNFRAKCDQANMYSQLGNVVKAKQLYFQLVETENEDDKAGALYYFGLFLDKQLRKTSEAMEQYKKAIKIQPDSFGGIRAGKEITEKMQRKVSENENDDKALELLGWVYSKNNYFDSACFHYDKAYELKSSDADFNPSNAVLTVKLAQLHIKSVAPDQAFDYLELIKMTDIDEYRRLKGKFHFVKGREYTRLGMNDKARLEFSSSAEYDDLEGCENLITLLGTCTDDAKYEKRWFEDLAKVISMSRKEPFLIQRYRGKISAKEIDKRINALNLAKNNIIMPAVLYLHDLYNKYVSFLADAQPNVIQCADVLLEARNLLDRVMADFQDREYGPKQSHCSFIYIKNTNSSVYLDLQRKLESPPRGGYGWTGFRSKYMALFDALVEIQPAYDFNENKNLIFLYDIVNRHKHNTAMCGDEEKLQIDGITHLVKLESLAEWSVIKVSKLVKEFDKHISK
ncbi:interferon-induced protein with tetratricopeptide repeats 5-like [Glandiceps talaboti]